MSYEPEYFEFLLKARQEKAFTGLQQFVRSTHYQIFILKGYAGTGKTTVMSGFIKWLYTAITRAKETRHVVNDWYIR